MAFCTNCGTKLKVGALFCTHCGAYVMQAGQPQPDSPMQMNVQPSGQGVAPTVVIVQPQISQEKPRLISEIEANGLSITSLVMGILSLAFSAFGVFGFVFGAIAKSKANTMIATGYPLDGRARAGRIMGTFGIILGISMTISWVVYGFFVMIKLAIPNL